MTLTELNELRTKRAGIVTEAGKLLTKAHTEKRAITPEEDQEWNRRHAEADEIESQIKREERQMQKEAELRAAPPPRAGQPDTRGNTEGAEEGDGLLDPKERAKRSKWFRQWCRTGMEGLPAEGRQFMAGRWQAQGAGIEFRDTLTGNTGADTTTAGGYTVAPDISMYSQIDIALKQYAWFEDAGCTMITTGTGADMPIPTNDDTTNKGELITELAQNSQQPFTFNQVTLKAYMFSSKISLVSFQLLQDSAINIDTFVGNMLGVRIGRILADYMTTGTGSSQPEGIQYVATSGKTAASPTAVTFLELLDLKHSVDPAYRKGARWMFHDTTLRNLKKIVDSYGRPLWKPGFGGYGQNAAPDTIDDDPYTINQSMPLTTAGLKPILYGAFSKFHIRKVQGYQMLRLTERYADYLAVGFLGFARYDSRLVDAGTHPVKALTMAAS